VGGADRAVARCSTVSTVSASAHTEPFPEQAWELVLARAGVDPDRFHLLPVPGAAVAGYN
jgi:hypothetical protein